MRREVQEKTKITISAGIAANAKLAKICSNQNKPNGQFLLASDRNTIMAFMRDLPTRKVNGVGRVFERELDAIGVRTCGDIYVYRQYLSKLFGEKVFHFLMQCYLGLGRTKVQPAEEYERKSVGTESTFGDLTGQAELREKLRWTADELEKDMKRTQFKGRTLVLKVKLHTYEVFTRQIIPPKAVFAADDLYKYSLPMLSKLEQDFPGLRLRLMGLRCTHLVSMKKPDTLSFFGFKRRTDIEDSPSTSGAELTRKRKASALEDGAEWEIWPEEEFEAAAREERQDELDEIEHLSQELTKRDEEEGDGYRRHGKEVVSNPRKETPKVEDWWDCPICMRPQAPSEKEFNEHIDLCLSRSTIKEAVQESSGREKSVDRKRPKIEKHETVVGDPKQRRLFFG